MLYGIMLLTSDFAELKVIIGNSVEFENLRSNLSLF